jgi:hypothetical protein
MDHDAWRRACVAFRAKLSRDTGVNLTAAACESLLGAAFQGEGSEEVTLQSKPGLFYTGLGAAIMNQSLLLGHPNHLNIAWWCFREAAEVHTTPRGMEKLATCYYTGAGVTPNPAQAAVWFHKAADLGDAGAKRALGAMLLNGDARAGIAKNAARGLALVRQAFAEGCSPALFHIAVCYVKGEGVEKDAAHGVSLLRQVITQDDVSKADAEIALSLCYMEGNGVAADTVQAAVWCRQAAEDSSERAIMMLPIILECDFCGTTPARQLCVRCRKVRYCDRQCQLAHWNRETDPHKGPCKEHCRRAAEASQQEAGSASTSAHQ